MGISTATIRELSDINKVTNTNKFKVKYKADSLREEPSPSHWSHHSKNDSARIKADTRELHIVHYPKYLQHGSCGNRETILSNHR